MSDTEPSPTELLERRLRLAHGFASGDRARVIAALGSLPKHLAHWNPERVELEVSVKDRDGPEQRVTLEARLPKWPPLVATAHHSDLDHAVAEARKDLIRRIDNEKTKRLPGGRRKASPKMI
jgi:ribosome-associated translation inhibitor RaiA